VSFYAACALWPVGGAVCLAQNIPSLQSHRAPGAEATGPRSRQYEEVQERLARGWNTWDVFSVGTQVLLPDGLAIHVGLKNNTSEWGDAWLGDMLIGRLERGAEVVTPGPHAWDGSYTDMRVEWQGHSLRVQSAHDGPDLVMLVTPLGSRKAPPLPPTLVFSVNYLWNRNGTAQRDADVILAHSPSGDVAIHCACDDLDPQSRLVYVPVGSPYFSMDLTRPVGLSTGRARSLPEIQQVIERQHSAYESSLGAQASTQPIVDAIQTTLGWDTIYEPEEKRVVSPVSRVWSISRGGYVIFDWDNFFAATLASIGDRDLAYANALEVLREETPLGFVPNSARAGGWKESDRSEPPVGSITVLGLYRKFHDRWFLADAFEPLLRWSRWWDQHRQMQGFIVLGSNPGAPPTNPDDKARGTWQGAIYESGMDNSPMYDGTFYNPKTRLLEYADVGMTSLYIADCDALAQIADVLNRSAEARELRERADRYRAKLATLWDPKVGMFLNRNLQTGEFNTRLSPTSFYPMLAKAASPAQARTMIEKHLLNPNEFWGQWIIASISRNDPAFKDQDYWRGRIWGPTNYLVYLGLRNYNDPSVRRQFAKKSYELFLKEWTEHRHVHENYSAITGSGDDVYHSDRFYHWGALLGYIEYLEEEQQPH
jgi:putative isomerase